MSHGPYQKDDNKMILGKMRNIRKLLEAREQERNELLLSLRQLGGDFVLPELPESLSSSRTSLTSSQTSLNSDLQSGSLPDLSFYGDRPSKRQLRKDHQIALQRAEELKCAIEQINYHLNVNRHRPEQYQYKLAQEREKLLEELERFELYIKTEEERVCEIFLL